MQQPADTISRNVMEAAIRNDTLPTPGCCRIVLIGYRATGKTTVARYIAQRLLGWTWCDADVELEQREGRTIADIFATDGEPHFRDLETEVLRELCRRNRCVVATGGGATMRAENRRLICSDGGNHDGSKDTGVTRSGEHGALTGQPLIVWLTASAETIDRRIRGDATSRARRPALTAAGETDPLAEVHRLLTMREPFYREIADLICDTETAAPEELAGWIIRVATGAE